MQLQAMWDGFQWRRSRDMEVVAEAAFWIRAMLDKKASPKRILNRMKSLGYRPDEPPKRRAGR